MQIRFNLTLGVSSYLISISLVTDRCAIYYITAPIRAQSTSFFLSLFPLSVDDFIKNHPFQELIASNATKTVTTSQLSTTEIVSPPPATIPVTPLIDTTPNKTTTDYQNIFFPTMFEEEEKYKSNMTSHCLNNAVRKF